MLIPGQPSTSHSYWDWRITLQSEVKQTTWNNRKIVIRRVRKKSWLWSTKVQFRLSCSIQFYSIMVLFTRIQGTEYPHGLKQNGRDKSTSSLLNLLELIPTSVSHYVQLCTVISSNNSLEVVRNNCNSVTIRYYKITKIVRALWLAERRVCMRVCKHGCMT